MSLQKESADAFRQCLRILAPRHTPEERRTQIRNVETYIAMGKWIPALRIKQIALLFYPYDSPLELAMLSKMEKAIEAQELISTPNEKDALMAADLAAWPDCPPVPQDSPLRYWLPDWMQTAQGTRAIPTRQQTAATPAPVVDVSASGGVEPDKAGPLPVEQGLSTKDIGHAFDGVNGWNAARWARNLSAAKWLHPARIALGRAGGASSVWSPVMLAQLMHDSTKGEREKERLMKLFNSRFTRNPALGLWRDAFNEYFATHCATD